MGATFKRRSILDATNGTRSQQFSSVWLAVDDATHHPEALAYFRRHFELQLPSIQAISDCERVLNNHCDRLSIRR